METLFYVNLAMTLLLAAIMGYDLVVNGFNKAFPMWLERLLSHALVANVFLWVFYIVFG